MFRRGYRSDRDINRARGERSMFPKVGSLKHPLPHEILGRIRRHFVGRVVTLAAATAFNAILSVALLPLATRQLGASDYGIYGLVISERGCGRRRRPASSSSLRSRVCIGACAAIR